MADVELLNRLDRVEAALRELALALGDVAEAVTADRKELGHQLATITSEGKLRGENVVAQVAAAAAKPSGAPWPLVYMLIVFVMGLTGMGFSLYAAANGDDAGKAIKDGRALIPDVPGITGQSDAPGVELDITDGEQPAIGGE